MHLLRPIPLTRSSILLNSAVRLYSTKQAPCINLTDLPAPNTGRIRILSLNRLAARNAISRQLLQELRTHIDSISAEYASDGSEVAPAARYGGAAGPDKKGPTRALIIASEVDSCFCAGADLKERAGFSPEEYALLISPPNICYILCTRSSHC
jgi:methylglutaconyl-CoA hydratase